MPMAVVMRVKSMQILDENFQEHCLSLNSTHHHRGGLDVLLLHQLLFQKLDVLLYLYWWCAICLFFLNNAGLYMILIMRKNLEPSIIAETYYYTGSSDVATGSLELAQVVQMSARVAEGCHW